MTRFMHATGAPVFDDANFVGYRGVGSDVTERVVAERKLLELARYDSWTDLANRAVFMDEFSQAIDHSLDVSASVDIAVFPDDGGDPGSLLRAADMAMYQAKSKGRNTFAVFSS